MDDKKLLEKGEQTLTNPSDLKNVKIEDDGRNLVIKMTKSFGYSFKINLKLAEGTKELQVTRPLLKVIEDLRSSERELRRLLQKKDHEIEEYKCEGGEIALRHLKTVPFNEEAHLSGHTAYANHFGTENISHGVLNKIVEVRVKPEPSHSNGASKEIKIEPGSEIKQEEDTRPTPTAAAARATPITLESNCSTLESSVKTEPAVKIEPRSQSQGVSPSKRHRKKLNL